MSSFEDTSNWKRKDGTTLTYSFEHNGKQHDGLSEKEPKILSAQLERLSVLNETSWQLKYDKEPESETGFLMREQISGLGILDDCHVHAITLDENKNEAITSLNVSIYPIELEKLLETSKVDSWSSFRDQEKKPEDGWLSDEVGRIHYGGMGEYHDKSLLFAILFLSQDKFDDLVLAIKAGGIRSARLEVLADVYHFNYEGIGLGMPGHEYNYAILCKDEGEGASGHTKARLEAMRLEWSPKLEMNRPGLPGGRLV